MLIIEEWIQDWLERDKDSRWMSEEQFAIHEIEKKKITERYNSMNICLFEDERVPKMLPLVYYRPVYDLLCGAALIKDKIRRQFPESSLFLHTRDYLAEKVNYGPTKRDPVDQITYQDSWGNPFK